MNRAQIDGLLSEFQASYDAETKNAIWQQHSSTFRTFWSETVLTQGTGPISDAECDVIIRILDRYGKGNTKESEAVARVMMPQGRWRKLFNILHTDQKLALLVNSVFEEKELDRKASLVDELYAANEGNRNGLTGETANVLNAMLAAYDPVANLAVVSLNDRRMQIDFLGLQMPFVWGDAPIGQRVVQSNELVREGTRALGIEGTARMLSCFWYYSTVKELWKPADTVRRTDKGEVKVSVPQDTEPEVDDTVGESDLRESFLIQAALADIGAQMGFRIWLPRSDRTRVLTKWKAQAGELLDHLPVGFDQATRKIIEQIDVLWIRRGTIQRAFEVEHTTSVYSGLLRMADLLAMQPNLKINLHIVAPVSRRDKVLQEIRRPVFSLLEGGALSDICSYLSYDTITDILGQEHLKRLSDKVLEDYEERAQDTD